MSFDRVSSRGMQCWWLDILTTTWQRQRIKQGTRILWQPWIRQGSRTQVGTSSHGTDRGLNTVGRGAFNAEDSRFPPGLTTPWAHTIDCSRMWRSGTHGTTRIVTWSWVASTELRLPHICATLGSGHASPSSLEQTQTGLTAYLLSSKGKFQIHLGGNAFVRHGYHQKPGISSTTGLRHANARTSEAPEHSDVGSRRVYRRTGVKYWPRRGLRWSLSSLLIRLLFKRHASG